MTLFWILLYLVAGFPIERASSGSTGAPLAQPTPEEHRG
jgi:hypothetical protein